MLRFVFMFSYIRFSLVMDLIIVIKIFKCKVHHVYCVHVRILCNLVVFFFISLELCMRYYVFGCKQPIEIEHLNLYKTVTYIS